MHDDGFQRRLGGQTKGPDFPRRMMDAADYNYRMPVWQRSPSRGPISPGFRHDQPGVVGNNIYHALVHKFNVKAKNQTRFESIIKGFNANAVTAGIQQSGDIVL